MQTSSNITTFLFTDIEGSTGKWEQEPERMAQAVTCHDVLLREAVAANNGRVIKTTGDGIYAAFADAADSVAAVIAIQTSLADPQATAGMEIRVRCGLHAGEAHQRDNDYFGSTINRTARVMGVAHGGQALLSQAVAELVRERLPTEVSLRDLGSVRLKGMATPENVYQLVHPQLRQDFPALSSLEATPNNLPQHLTSFVGRERELEEAEALLGKTRLLTLLGMGGLGKTRLSQQIGADLLDSYPDGVWFVDLAPIRDASLVPSETAQVLKVQEEPGKPLMQTLVAHLKSRKLLLIIDNCEHLMAPSANLANALLRGAPEVRIIATSREALRVPGEQTYPVLPLPVPERTAGVEALMQSTAVQLFVERAKSQKPSFELNEKEAPAVAELVGRLEGIPLALELAAARMRSLSVSDINTRLKDRYKLLTGGGRVLLERQQTLRALVDWSYDMLPENEQMQFDRLAVFAGGFDLSAAEAVCGADPLMPEDVLDLVTSLVDKSLVMVEEGDDGTRYRMLETLRDYAREKLVNRGEAAATAVRHCDHYLSLAKQGNRELQGPGQAEWTRRLETELDNLRAGITLALEAGTDPILAVKFEVALQGFWMFRGYATEGRRYVQIALTLPGVQASAVAHAHALYVGAALADSQGDYAEAERLLEPCLTLRRGLDNPVEIAAAESLLGQVRLHEGDADGARKCDEEALSLFRQIGDRIGEAVVLAQLGEVAVYVSDDRSARENFEGSLAISKALSYYELEGDCEWMLGDLSLEAGDLAAARARFANSLAVYRKSGDKRGEMTAIWRMAKADIAGRDPESARIKLAGALRAFQGFDMKAHLLSCLEDYAELLQSSDAAEAAVCFCGAAAALRERHAVPRAPRARVRWTNNIKAARQLLGDIAFEEAWSRGAAWDIKAAVRSALASRVDLVATV